MLSFVVPAHNEAAEIPRTLESVFTAARAVNLPFEVVVVNDASTDDTAAMARAAGARVVEVDRRQISAVRNAGARASRGEVLFFVDADTRISGTVVRAALCALDQGAVGGGARVEMDEPGSWLARMTLHFFNSIYMGLLGWAAGCFIFVQRAAFDAVGGFDENLFAGEEIYLSRKLKRQGQFVIVRESVVTSNRKLRMYSAWSIVPLLLRFLRHGPAILRRRQGLDWWYDGRR